MRAVAWIITGINILFSVRTLFNAIDRNSKYSLGMTWLAGALFLLLGAYGAYALYTQQPPRTVVAIGLAPWLLFVGLMAITLITGDWR